MRKKSLLLFTSILLLVSCSGGNTSHNTTPIDDSKLTDFSDYDDLETYENKLKMKESVNGSTESPDPFIYRFNGMYYLYATTNGGYVKAYKSSNLIEWEPVDNGVLNRGICYDYSKDENAPQEKTPYAPEVIYYNGKFYMTASPLGKGHYIFESDSPEGPFKTITGNVGRSIDGSFFIDKNENVYFYGANGGGIVVYELDNDFKTFKDSKGDLTSCRVGNWNEGPYLLNRNGDYYLTYCGTHYLSTNYRVDYAFASGEDSLMRDSSYTREDTVLLSTKENFNGLGHSCTVLGPDMDSYYIVYHNLEGIRNLNLSRLSFNGSTMVANQVREGEITGIYASNYSSNGLDNFEKVGEFYLSGDETSETFTCEFNTIGEGKMVFSYVDENNYSYIDFINNTIDIVSLNNGKKNFINSIELVKEYDTSVYHSFRLQYNDGLMNFYFDNIEKLALESASFPKGKIGYMKNSTFSEYGYTAFSNVALGTSDKKAYDENISLANGYVDELSILNNGSELQYIDSSNDFTRNGSNNLVLKNKNDRATYRFQVTEDNNYAINLRVNSASINKKIGVRIDDGEINEVILPSQKGQIAKGDLLVNVLNCSLTQGPHHFSIYNLDDEIAFSEIRYEMVDEGKTNEHSLTKNNFEDDAFYIRNEMNLDQNGVNSNNQETCGIITKDNYFNAELSVDMNIQSIESGGYVSLLMNISDYSVNYYGDADGISSFNTYRGYRFEIDKTRLKVQYVDYNFTKLLRVEKINYNFGEDINVILKQENNTITCYLDDNQVLSFVCNVGNMSGGVGFMASNAKATFYQMRIS